MLNCRSKYCEEEKKKGAEGGKIKKARKDKAKQAQTRGLNAIKKVSR